MENELAAPRARLVRLTRSEAARYVGACGESTIRAAEAKGLPVLYDADGQIWHCPVALDAWKWRNEGPSKARREQVIRDATKARTREAREQERRRALESERELAEWNAELAKSDARHQAEQTLRQSVRRKNEGTRAAFELAHLDERTAGRALGLQPHEARYYLRNLVSCGLLRRVNGPREIRVEATNDVPREVETSWPLCRGGPFYLRDDVLALHRALSTIGSEAARNGLAGAQLRASDDLIAEVLRHVRRASR